MPVRISAVVLVSLLSLSACGSSGTVPLTPDEMDLVRLRDVAELYREHQVSAKTPLDP